MHLLGLLLAGVASIVGRNLFEEIEFDEIPDAVECQKMCQETEGSSMSLLNDSNNIKFIHQIYWYFLWVKNVTDQIYWYLSWLKI